MIAVLFLLLRPLTKDLTRGKSYHEWNYSIVGLRLWHCNFMKKTQLPEWIFCNNLKNYCSTFFGDCLQCKNNFSKHITELNAQFLVSETETGIELHMIAESKHEGE